MGGGRPGALAVERAGHAHILQREYEQYGNAGGSCIPSGTYIGRGEPFRM